jgi:hypothetical protein
VDLVRINQSSFILNTLQRLWQAWGHSGRGGGSPVPDTLQLHQNARGRTAAAVVLSGMVIHFVQSVYLLIVR